MTARPRPLPSRDDALAYEDYVVEVMKKRSSPKSRWENAGVVPAATAILTVIVTSIVSCYTQGLLREKENRVVETRERAQAALLAADRANTALADMLKVNEERFKIARGDYSSDTSLLRQGKLLSEQDNQSQQAWRKNREDVEMQLYLAFDSTLAVSPAWQKAREAIEKETACVENLVELTHRGRDDIGERLRLCDDAIEDRKQAVNGLRSRLQVGYERTRNGR